MIRKMFLHLTATLCCVTLLTACGNTTNKEQKGTEDNHSVNQLVGNDKDDNGCIASAGYQWSELLKNCIRPFEKGIRLKSTTDKNVSLAAYLVFNADSTKVEIYVPGVKKHEILDLQASSTTNKNPDTNILYISNTAKDFCVKKVDGNWNLYQNNQLTFVTDNQK